MAKEFYTERDIEDMVKRGILSLQVSDNVVLTELAYERAKRLGMQLLREKPMEPPAAPVRPYLSEPSSPSWGLSPTLPPRGKGRWLSELDKPGAATQASEPNLSARIHAAVTARLGTQVDPALLDVIIERVLKSTGAK
jgi:hypothetical protein